MNLELLGLFTPQMVECLVSIRVKPGRLCRSGEPQSSNEWMQVERRDGHDGVKWAVTDNRLCLNHRGQWESEPMPSSRSDAFLKRCRFDTFDEAVKSGIALRAQMT